MGKPQDPRDTPVLDGLAQLEQIIADRLHEDANAVALGATTVAVRKSTGGMAVFRKVDVGNDLRSTYQRLERTARAVVRAAAQQNPRLITPEDITTFPFLHQVALEQAEHLLPETRVHLGLNAESTQ